MAMSAPGATGSVRMGSSKMRPSQGANRKIVGAVVGALEPLSPESRLPKMAPSAAATANRSSPPPGASVATLPPASAPSSIASSEAVQVRIVGTAVIVPLSSTGKR